MISNCHTELAEVHCLDVLIAFRQAQRDKF